MQGANRSKVGHLARIYNAAEPVLWRKSRRNTNCQQPLGNCAYHIGQKSLNNTHANPLLMLNLIYGAAWLLTLLLMPLFGKASVADAAALAGSWKIWLVAGGTMIIELGFVLAYQSGGAVQWSGAAVAGMAALMLAPAGVLLFGEPFSWHKALGVVLTLSGLALIAHQ